MLVNLGSPYESMLDSIIAKEYAGNKTEAIRQAIKAYIDKIQDEEALAVERLVNEEMSKIKKGEIKTHSLESVLEELGEKID